jgi:hypothetical protein
MAGAGGAAGAAQGTPLAQGEDAPREIVVDDGNIYWATTHAVRSLPKAGGTPTTLFTSSQNTPTTLTADATNLYFGYVMSPTAVLTVPKAGGQAVMLVATGQPSGFVIDADFVYWFDSSDNMVRRTAKAGGGTPEVLAAQPPLNLAAIDDQSLYGFTTQAEPRIGRIAKADGTTTILRPSDPATIFIRQLAIDPSYVYFTTFMITAQSSVLNRMTKTGGDMTELASGLDQAAALAVTSDAIYWITAGDSGPPGYLARIPIAGGAAVNVATASHPVGLAVDAQYAYWTEFGTLGSRDGRVMRVAR